jgi:hypothetical protein
MIQQLLANLVMLFVILVQVESIMNVKAVRDPRIENLMMFQNVFVQMDFILITSHLMALVPRDWFAESVIINVLLAKMIIPILIAILAMKPHSSEN